MPMNLKKYFCLLLPAVAMTTQTLAEPVRFASGVKQVSLLELYSSEGCSSCPPAEAWINKLKDSPDLWKNFVPLSFHVDYWDSLGWKDHWSSPEFSERQRDYAKLWRAENIYTPEFVLNGQEWRNWFGLRSAPSVSGADAGGLEINSTNGSRWSVSFTPVGGANGKYEIHAALLAGGIVSEVKAGENRGRTLPHEFAVVDLVQLGMTSSNGVANGKFILNLARHAAGKNLAVTAWVTRAGEMTPLQAAGGWLPVLAQAPAK